MKIALLLGSVRNGRQTDKLAYYLESQLQKSGAETDLIDLKETPLPIMEERLRADAQPHPNVIRTGKRLRDADAIIFISPEYHASYTGALKNAIDYYWSEFAKKPIGVATAAGGKFGGINASAQMQQLILSIGGYPISTKLVIPHIQNAFNENNEPTEETATSVERFLNEFLWFSHAIVAAKKELEIKSSLV